MLEVKGIDTYYGNVQVLKDVSLHVNEGEMVAVIGANGAGKTTLIKAISGLITPKTGEIFFNGKLISKQAVHNTVYDGVVQVPEGRKLFPRMSVLDNLEMGGYTLKTRAELDERLEVVYKFLPVLKDRAAQIAGTMSGGEQQMLAIGRALMANPRMVMFDEPSLGLAPKLVQDVFDMVVSINKELGVSILLVEQNVQHCCLISDRAYVLENGEVVLEGTGAEMLNNDHVRRAYLGL